MNLELQDKKNETIQPVSTNINQEQAPSCETSIVDDLEYLRTACNFLSVGNKEINIKNFCEFDKTKQKEEEIEQRRVTEQSTAKPVIVNLNQSEMRQGSADQSEPASTAKSRILL